MELRHLRRLRHQRRHLPDVVRRFRHLLGVDRPGPGRPDAVRRHPVGVDRELVHHHVVDADRRYLDRQHPGGVGLGLLDVDRPGRLRRAFPAVRRMASCPDVDRLDVELLRRRPVGVVHGSGRRRGNHDVHPRRAFPAARRTGCCRGVGRQLAWVPALDLGVDRPGPGLPEPWLPGRPPREPWPLVLLPPERLEPPEQLAT